MFDWTFVRNAGRWLMWFPALIVFAGIYEMINPVTVDGADVSRSSPALGWGLIAVGIALALMGVMMDRRNSH